MIRVRCFGRFSDLLEDETGLEIAADDLATVEDVYRYLSRAHPQLHEQIDDGQVLVAVNQHIVSRGAALDDGDEVAFLPPVTGG